MHDSEYLKFCPECKKLHLPKMFKGGWGYIFMPTPTENTCEFGHKIQILDIPLDDFWIWHDTNISTDFFDAMVSLHDENIIEYELKMSQLRTQVEQQKAAAESNKPKCPTCQSTNIRKISATSKLTNVVLFGLFGNKRNKQFHCNSCGYEW